MTEQYVHVDISQNHRMSELEAAWLRLQLPPPRRRQRAAGATIARRYRDAAPRLRWHADHPDHVVHQCVVRVADRERLRAAPRRPRRGDRRPLPARPRPSSRPTGTSPRPPCPQAEAWAAECVSLPCFPELTDDEVDHVADALEDLGA